MNKTKKPKRKQTNPLGTNFPTGGNKIFTGVNLPPAIRGAVDTLAGENNRSLSSMMTILTIEALTAREEK